MVFLPNFENVVSSSIPKPRSPIIRESPVRSNRSVHSIQTRISTALYREFLRRMLDYLKTNPLPQDMLACSSEIITSIFAAATSSPLPQWCALVSMQQDYQGRKYEKIRAELRKMYETKPSLWTIHRD